MKTLAAILGLVVLGTVFVWERGATRTLQSDNESLRVVREEADRLAAENRDGQKLRAAARSAGRPGPPELVELLDLRNRIRSLRAQQREVEELRAANRRLADEIKSGQFAPRPVAEMPDAVPRERWVFAGFATPEATVQSLFAGIVAGEMEQFINCLTPERAAEMRADLAQDPRGEQESFKAGLSEFTRTSAYRIAAQRVRAADEVWLTVQVNTEDEPTPMSVPLRRVNGEWKIDPELVEPPE
jgi:hypothetical protein